MDFSSLFIPLLFFPPVSYSAVPLQSRLFLLFSSINRFCSGQVRSSPSTVVSALIVTRSASVRRLFMLFYSPIPLQSVDCSCCSRRLIASLLASFALVRRLFLLFQSPVPLQSIDCFCSSSRPFSFSPSIVCALLVY